MQYDAVILAGGVNSSELKKIAPYDNEALIIIGKYPMIYYVYNALRQSSQVRNIVISGPTEALRNIFAREEKLFLWREGKRGGKPGLCSKAFTEKGTTERLLVLPRIFLYHHHGHR